MVASCAEAAGAPLVLADELAIRGEPIWRFGRADDDRVRPAHARAVHHRPDRVAPALELRRGLAGRSALAGAGIAIPRDAVRTGFAAARWPGRLEIVEPDPMVVVDGAHTPLAVAQIVASMRELLGRRRGPVIFGAYRDKLVPEMIGELGAFATDLIVLAPDHPRGWAPERLLRRYPEVGPARIARDAFEALAMARAACEPGQAVLATGASRSPPTFAPPPVYRVTPIPPSRWCTDVRITLIRHAESETNASDRAAGSLHVGLSPEGRAPGGPAGPAHACVRCGSLPRQRLGACTAHGGARL